MARNKKPNPWLELQALIERYACACRNDEMKGGGDSESIPVIEAELVLALAKLNEHIAVMRRTLEQP